MEKLNRTALVLGMTLLMVGMSFATTFGGAEDHVLPPSVTKELSSDTIYIGSYETETTVTITVTGDGGTSTTITPMDVVFAIDSSGSMTTNDPDDDRLTAAKGFVDNMDDTRDLAGVVSWDLDVEFAKGLWSDFDDVDGIKYWIDQVDSAGWTDPDDGLAASVQMLDDTGQLESIKVIIFLTDGYPAGPFGDPGTYTYFGDGGPVDNAAVVGYIIYGIGLGDSHSSAILEDMADATGGAYYDSPDPDNLQAIYDAIYDEIVTSTIPHNVDVCEVLEEYIVLDTTSFNIAPDTITYNGDGTTTIKWLNVGQYVGNFDDALTADETVTLMFDVGADKAGYQLPVQVLPGAKVDYYNVDDAFIGSVAIPQAYINVVQMADLIAAGGNEASAIDVGHVVMWQDADNLYVKFVTVGGWSMTETHLHVAADDPNDIPQTKTGNPKVGKFDYQASHSPAVQEYTFTIPWDDDWDAGTILYIAAHANVQMMTGYDDDGEPTYQFETAWGDGTDFDGRNWATYIEYVDP